MGHFHFSPLCDPQGFGNKAREHSSGRKTKSKKLRGLVYIYLHLIQFKHGEGEPLSKACLPVGCMGNSVAQTPPPPPPLSQLTSPNSMTLGFFIVPDSLALLTGWVSFRGVHKVGPVRGPQEASFLSQKYLLSTTCMHPEKLSLFLTYKPEPACGRGLGCMSPEEASRPTPNTLLPCTIHGDVISN